MKKHSNKIIADVDFEVKEKLYRLSHEAHESMKETLVRIIEKEYEAVFKN